MNTNFAGIWHLEPDDGFTSAVALDRVAVNRSRVAMIRSRQNMVRRGPRRAVKKSRTLFSQYSAGWSFDVGDDFLALKIIAEAMADKGSATAITDGFEWTIGQAVAGHRTFAGYAVTADGDSYRLNNGILQEVALTIEPNRIVAAEARFAFAGINDGVALVGPDTVAAPATFASPINASITWDGEPIEAFAMALNISRDLQPAAMNTAGVFTGSRGRTVPDIVGTMAVRIPIDDDDLFLDQAFRTVVLTIEVGGKTMTLTLPAVAFEMTGRNVVDAGFVEHQVQFLAMLQGVNPLARISLVEP